MKITKYKKLSGNRYKIELDNFSELILYEDVILDNNILYKKEIDDDLIKKIELENIYYESYHKALKFVTNKMRSIYEVTNYLKKLDIKEKDVSKIISKLKELNLLNDSLYTEAYISDKINLSNDGPIKIKRDLMDKKIDESIIDIELSKYSDEIFINKIKKIISKKKNLKYSNLLFKQKLLQNLVNLGYSSTLVMPIINTFDFKCPNIIKKEYDNLYNKLSKKYDNNKLEYEIKSRLYKKGFSMDEINNIKE